MKITKDNIVLENVEDRQILFDAIMRYRLICLELAKSDHFAADVFAELGKEIEDNIQIPMYKTWDDIVH